MGGSQHVFTVTYSRMVSEHVCDVTINMWEMSDMRYLYMDHTGGDQADLHSRPSFQPTWRTLFIENMFHPTLFIFCQCGPRVPGEYISLDLRYRNNLLISVLSPGYLTIMVIGLSSFQIIYLVSFSLLKKPEKDHFGNKSFIQFFKKFSETFNRPSQYFKANL